MFAVDNVEVDASEKIVIPGEKLNGLQVDLQNLEERKQKKQGKICFFPYIFLYDEDKI